MDVYENQKFQVTDASHSFARGEYAEMQIKHENQYERSGRLGASDLPAPRERGATDLQKHQPASATFSLEENASKSLGVNRGCDKRAITFTAVLAVLFFGFAATTIVFYFQQRAELKAVRDALATANDQVGELKNETKAQASVSGLYEKKLTVAENKIRALENRSQAQIQKSDEMFNSLTISDAKISDLENGVTGYCPLRYNGKCFWVEIRNDHVSQIQASEICAAQGGRLANIYSEDHYDMMTGYMRMFTRSSTGYFHAWIGMTYSKDNKAISLSDGSAAPFKKWRPQQPALHSCCYMYLFVRADVKAADQHMCTNARSNRLEGVFCQK